MVKLQWNSTSDISLENIRDFEILFWIVASSYLNRQKNIFKVGNTVKNISAIDVIMISLL